ncbi:MAG TPA: DUF4382 domain-containing protein [Thermoplasmata archaeon]|nr:DUF4382 domain-containing protein [Thermoplasmata archaeon]
MRNKILLSLSIFFGLAFLLGAERGCVPEIPVSPLEAGKLVLLITDKPIGGEEVLEVNVTISQIMVHKALLGEEVPEGEVEAQEVPKGEKEDKTWIVITEEPKEFDLIKLSDAQELLGGKELEPGRYTQLRLTVEALEIIIKEDDEEKPYDLKLRGQSRLKIVRGFEIVAGETTELLLDFDAEKSIKKTGKGVYFLKPTIKLAKETRKPMEEE